jgi:putative NIF3 family GTP cyclohydrolase 1 type 2
LELDCDTIVTHHPAIYSPIKSLDEDGDTAALLTAIKNGLNVISMHLNLDIAKNGIDQSLINAIGGKDTRIIEVIDGECGYGKESVIENISAEDFLQGLKEKFSSDANVKSPVAVTVSVVTFPSGICILPEVLSLWGRYKLP